MFYIKLLSYRSEGTLARSPMLVHLSWVSRKLARASGILFRTYKGHLFSGECPKNLASHTVISIWICFVEVRLSYSHPIFTMEIPMLV